MLDLYQSTSPNNGIILSWQEKKYTIEKKTGKGGCYRIKCMRGWFSTMKGTSVMTEVKQTCIKIYQKVWGQCLLNLLATKIYQNVSTC